MLQELTLAKSVILQCGLEHVRMWKLAELLQVVESCPSFESLDPLGLQIDAQRCLQSPAWSMLTRLCNVSTRNSLYSQVCQASELDCLQPRDRVYALLNIPQSGLQHIRPDYSSAIVDVVMAVIRHERNLHEVYNPDAFPQQHTAICAAIGVDVKNVIEEDLQLQLEDPEDRYHH